MSSTALKPAPRFSRDSLHGYQERAVSFVKDTPSCALWVDMGLGKTVTVLTAVSDLLHRFETGRVLVIAPLRVAMKTWPSEVQQWEHTQHLTSRVIKGTPAQRLNILLHDRSDIHIINRELITWLVETIQNNPESRTDALANGWPYDMVIIDEASSFKSSKTKRFKALRRMLPWIDRLIELTGTPASNGLLDVWSQIFLMDRGDRLGKTFTSFRDRYFLGDFHGYSWTIKKNADQKIYEKLDDICLTLTAADYLELPKRIDNMVEVELPTKARQQYQQLEKEFLAEIGEGEIVAVLHAAALTNKLLQFANGAIYTDDQKNWSPVHDAKLEALAELVEEAAGQPLLVAYNYRTDLTRILDRFPQAEAIGRDPNTIDRWNKGDIPLLLAHPASAGHGLNLQHGGNTIIWFGLNWSLELYQQFNARLHRQGQEKPVIIHHIAAHNTVDETVLAALARKDVTQRALLNALKQDIGGRA
ncbi:MAG: DEAD/DEAH box helicase [Alphaproteobacteria bacterium]|nr:DEAD/DEAH box helicase [Alphaproteobacteria bacterium]